MDLVGWLGFVSIYIAWLLHFSAIFRNHIGKYTMGGSKNSLGTRLFVGTVACFNIYLAIKLGASAPFTITF